MTERIHFHFLPSCTGEGNGNPLQCSCLENPRDRGAWWAARGGTESDTTEATAAAAATAEVQYIGASGIFLWANYFLVQFKYLSKPQRVWSSPFCMCLLFWYLKCLILFNAYNSLIIDVHLPILQMGKLRPRGKMPKISRLLRDRIEIQT